MVDQLGSFASEVTRVAREAAPRKLGGQAQVKGVAGTWKDLTDSVNSMAGNLTGQVRNIAQVTTAVANGDLSKKITVDVRGEILELKDTINTMVDQLGSFATEVTRVAREVGVGGAAGRPGPGTRRGRGVEGPHRLRQLDGGQPDRAGAQHREVTTAVANGDLAQKITVDVQGEILQLKETINTMVDQLKFLRLRGDAGGQGGGHRGQARRPGRGQGGGRHLEGPHRQRQRHGRQPHRPGAQHRAVATAIANGDLSQKITVDVKGEILQLKDTTNKMVDQLNTLRRRGHPRPRARGGHRGQAGRPGRGQGGGRTWKELTDSVNAMAGSLTARCATSRGSPPPIANGDLSQKITVDVKGEILQLKDTINKMVDNLNTFAGEVTRVAREVGTEGKLGGQARSRGWPAPGRT